MTKRLTLQYIKNKTRELAEDYIDKNWRSLTNG